MPNGFVNSIDATTFIVSPRRTMSVTTYWESETTLPDLATLQTAANDFQDWFANLIKPLMPDQISLPMSRLVCHGSGALLLADAYSDTSHAKVGTAAVVVLEDPGSRALPDQDALVIQRRTGQPGRASRGRIFIPGIWEDFNDDGQLADDAIITAEGIAAEMGTDQIFAGITHHARHWNRAANLFMVVTQCRAMKNLGSRRDRQPRGPNLPV